MTFNIQVSSAFATKCSKFRGRAIMAKVRNSQTSHALQMEIDNEIKRIVQTYNNTNIKQQPGIAATREAYRLLGKDPSRYRPSSEQLARRILQGKGLYTISTLVDLGNLLSLLSGYSIAVLDASKIAGETIELSVGEKEEPYEAIGRGKLNIENLPVYRDVIGGFATPTSDNVRTMIDENTTSVLILINGYDGDEVMLDKTVKLGKRLLTTYAHAIGFTECSY